MARADQELPSCRAPKLHIASLVVADLANTWWIWPWGHFVPQLTGGRAKAQRKRGSLCEAIDFNSESSNHAMSSSNLSGGLQFYPRLGSKASGKQSNEYGADCCNAITVTLAMSLPSNSRQDARPPWRASYPANGFLKMEWNHTSPNMSQMPPAIYLTRQITWAQRLGSTGHLITHKIALRARLRVSEDKIRMTRCHRMCTVHYGDDWQVWTTKVCCLSDRSIKIWFKTSPSLPSF